MTTRILTGAVGCLAGSYGAYLLLTRGRELTDVAGWLVAGVVLHDVVLAPLVIVLLAVATRLLPSYARGPAVVGLVVVGSATLFAIPVLGRFGARDDNPTLLNRDYTSGWLVLTGITVVAVVAAALVLRSRQGAGGEHGARPGRR